MKIPFTRAFVAGLLGLALGLPAVSLSGCRGDAEEREEAVRDWEADEVDATADDMEERGEALEDMGEDLGNEAIEGRGDEMEDRGDALDEYGEDLDD
jgi:hypothetical protein